MNKTIAEACGIDKTLSIKTRLKTNFPNSSSMQTYVENAKGHILFTVDGDDDQATQKAQEFVDNYYPKS